MVQDRAIFTTAEFGRLSVTNAWRGEAPSVLCKYKAHPQGKNYSVGEREALAIIWAVKKFHRYLYGQHFTLESDRRPLEYLQTSHSQNPRIMRWSLALQTYRYTVKYIRGSENVVAGYLSRSN